MWPLGLLNPGRRSIAKLPGPRAALSFANWDIEDSLLIWLSVSKLKTSNLLKMNPLDGLPPMPHTRPPPPYPPSYTLQRTHRMSYSQMLTGETPSPLSLMGRRGEKEVTAGPSVLWAFEMTLL